MPKKQLTTEYIRSLNENTFDLANYAIRLARFYVQSGHETSATSILKEISKHPNESYLDMLITLEEEEEVQEYDNLNV